MTQGSKDKDKDSKGLRKLEGSGKRLLSAVEESVSHRTEHHTHDVKLFILRNCRRKFT